MEKRVDNKFTWVIKNFSSSGSYRIYSEPFLVRGCEWYISADPKGSENINNLFVFLHVADPGYLPSGWRRHVKFSFTIVNQIWGKLSQLEKRQHWFDVKSLGWGSTDAISLTKLHAKDSGFLVNDELKLVAEIEILEVIGQLDVSEIINVRGFHVLPFQVKYVRRLFERDSDVATNLREKNQYLKTGYMNVIIGLTETVRRSSKEISKADLADAYVALKSMTVAGFKLDWLEEKLDQMSKKKEKEEAGETRVREIEEELKGLKQKCSDLDAQLAKEKAEVLAARTPLLLSTDEL